MSLNVLTDRPTTSSPLPFNQYFTAASSIVSPSPSPEHDAVATATDTATDTDVDMKTRSNPGQGALKSARVHAYARQAKKAHAVSHQSTAASGGRKAGMSPGLAATIAKLRYSPPAAVMAEINKQKQQKQMLSRDAMMLQEEEYAEEVLEHWREREVATRAEVTNMDQQPELRWEMRPCLVEFLIEVHLMARMRPETLYLAINIVDRYVSKRIVLKKHYQLVGCAALWIAAKYEDEKSRIHTLADLADICRHTYEQTAFVQMERHVLATIGWDLGHPTAEGWMRVKCSGETGWEHARTQHVARFLMELTLFKKEFVHLLPSQIAHGALCLAKYILGESRLSRNEDTTETREVSEALDEMCASGVQLLSETVVKKYQPLYYSGASRIVAEWYAKGNRYHYSPFPEWNIDLPSTPDAYKTFYGSTLSRSGSSMDSISPLSASGSSNASDSMPATPITPMYPHSDSYLNVGGKENQVQGMLFGVTSEMAMRAKDEPMAKPEDILAPLNQHTNVYPTRTSFIVPQLSVDGSHAVQYDFSVA